MPLSSKPVALVTGSARGIGRAIAIRLAADGYAVIINSVSVPAPGQPSPADQTVGAIQSAGGTAHAIRADISDPAGRARLLADILSNFGRLDLLVNNAGIAPERRADILQATPESFDRLIATNLKAPYFLTQSAATIMVDLLKAGTIPKARICFITSISAYAASVNRGDYCISKAGLSMAAALWASRLAEFYIPVIEIRPGIVATDMTAGVRDKYDTLIAAGLMPQNRWGQPEDVAKIVASFAKGDLDYSTGIAIDASGGFQLKRL